MLSDSGQALANLREGHLCLTSHRLGMESITALRRTWPTLRWLGKHEMARCECVEELFEAVVVRSSGVEDIGVRIIFAAWRLICAHEQQQRGGVGAGRKGCSSPCARNTVGEAHGR
jgi:hypothetical protein